MPIWDLTNENETVLLAKMKRDFMARKHLEMALSHKWWERHLRGFEAQVPPPLMRNLYLLFRTKELNAAAMLDMSQAAIKSEGDDSVVESSPPAFIDHEFEEKQLLSVPDGSVDLAILLGFDQDINSNRMKFRNDIIQRFTQQSGMNN